MIFNATAILIDEFVDKLKQSYQRMFGGYKADYSEIIAWAGRMALENISGSDALYHDVEHTILVTLVGQEILNGRHMKEGGVSCEDWLHLTISLLCHDIGYVRGVCRNDNRRAHSYDCGDGSFVTLPPGASDASLTPYHVARGKLFIQERFKGHWLIDAERIQENIEHTRFPVPQGSDPKELSHSGIVRSADLIGQLGDPRYLQKLHALFYEFKETGAADAMGFRDAEDLRLGYPTFFWAGVYPFVSEALDYLDRTQEGKQILANLYANVFRQEHIHPDTSASD